MMEYWATIVADDSRASDWQSVFGTLTVPIESPIPCNVTLPGYDQPQEVYILDWRLLPVDVVGRLVRLISVRFDIPPTKVLRGLAQHGVPLLAHDVLVTISFGEEVR